MTSRLNHHFVPQYLFKLFSGGQRYIHFLSKASAKTVYFASIRHQCARHRFYGPQKVEDFLARLDGRHSKAYRAVLRECWSKASAGLTTDELYWLLEAVMLQRARTPRAAEILAHDSERLALYSFREYVKCSPDDGTRDAIIQAIDRGQVVIRAPVLRSLMHSLAIALQSVIGITDLNLALLRNVTQRPFVFGDSPCVFYNKYLWSVPNVGGLGLQSKGLMIFMPVNEKTQVMLYDPDTYALGSTRRIVDLTESSDVSQLNALQVHSAKQAVYFANRASADYVTEIITAHRPLLASSNSEFRRLRPGYTLIDGKPNDTEVIHFFESQLPLNMDLSFVTAKSLSLDENPRSPRCAHLRRAIIRGIDRKG